MPLYRYEAIDPEGVVVEATMRAGEPDEVITQLRARDYEVRRVEEADVAASTRDRVPRRQRHDRPPPAPRTVEKVRGGWLGTGAFMVLFGSLFGGIGLVVGLAQLVAAVSGAGRGFYIGALIGLTFAAVGGGFIIQYLRMSRRLRRLLEHGAVAEGVVTSTGVDGSVRMNGRPAYKMGYTFRTVYGDQIDGSLRTFNDAITEYVDGEPVWIVFDSEDPDNNSLWPRV